MSIDTFDEAAKHYAETRPIVSCNHTKEQDIRPIGERRRKWERIEHVNRNKYVLHDMLPCATEWGTPYLARPPVVWREETGENKLPCVVLFVAAVTQVDTIFYVHGSRWV